MLEYEATLKDHADELRLSAADVEVIVDRMCEVSDRHQVFFLWRPSLRDPGDEFILELAVGAQCDAIVTHNVRDFEGARRFPVQVMTPSGFLRKMRGRS